MFDPKLDRAYGSQYRVSIHHSARFWSGNALRIKIQKRRLLTVHAINSRDMTESIISKLFFYIKIENDTEKQKFFLGGHAGGDVRGSIDGIGMRKRL